MKTLLFMRFAAFLLLFFISPNLLGLELPSDLDKSERNDVLQIFGVNTSSKLLSNPHPLGGYSGWQLGVSVEVVNTDELSRMGSKTEPQQELRYPRISFGKGLYHNVDLFLHFTPYAEDLDVQEFGGIVKWCFYQSEFLPMSVSVMGYGSNLNVRDSLTSQSVGADLLIGINANSFALYFGAGEIKTEGEFMATGSGSMISAGDSEINANNTIQQTTQSGHSFVGFSIDFDNIFIAAQLDRYKTPTYSAKIGFRL